MNLSQQDLADRLGVSFSTINRWENRKSKPTKLAQNSVFELVRSSGVDVSGFIYDRIKKAAGCVDTSGKRIVLYHGSKSGIKGDIAPISRDKCDFGKGFYMGTIPEQPLTLICDYPQSKFYIVSIDLSGLKKTCITPDINWALLVALKRGKMDEIAGTDFYNKIVSLSSGYDVITGSIANDRMFFVLDNFFQGNITDTALVESLSALNLGQQVVAVTQKSCDKVRIEKEIELSYFERLILKEKAETLRLKGISLANDICRAHRRDGLFFDEILAKAKEA